MNNHANTVKQFVHRNKNALVVAAIATTVIVLQHKGIKSLNAFLDEKGLTDEYYIPEA